MYLSFVGICACFLEDWLGILDGWEELHLTLLMSFARAFSTRWKVFGTLQYLSQNSSLLIHFNYAWITPG